MTKKEQLKADLTENIKECERFEKKAAKQGKYSDAIKLQGMADAYKKALWKVERILTTED